MEKVKHKKERTLQGFFPIIVFLLLIIYVISFLTPLIWSVFSSFKTRMEFMSSPFGFPKKISLDNYKKVIDVFYVPVKVQGHDSRKAGLGELMTNTIIYAVVATFISTFSHAIPAYICAKYSHRFITKILYVIVIVVMVLPIVGNLSSELALMHKLNFYDNIFGIWFMKSGFLGVNFLIFYATYKGISWEYAEAAFIDGANNTQVLFNIMLPLSKVTISTVAVVSFIEYWNDWRVNVVYMPSYPVIAYALFVFERNPINSISAPPYKLAGCMMVALPMIIFFILFRNKLMGNITTGGIKG